MNTAQLEKAKYDRNHFDYGVTGLKNHLKIMANQQAKKDNTRTFVLENEHCPEHIIGYYTLTMTPIGAEGLPAKLSHFLLSLLMRKMVRGISMKNMASHPLRMPVINCL